VVATDRSPRDDLPHVMGDRIQLKQVLLNLLLNPAEAMREVSPVRRRVVVRAIADHRDDGPWAIVTIENALRRGRGATLVRGCTRRSRVGWAWEYRSVARSWTATGVGSGPRRTPTMALRSTSR